MLYDTSHFLKCNAARLHIFASGCMYKLYCRKFFPMLFADWNLHGSSHTRTYENMDTPSLRRFRGSVRDTANGRVITVKNYFSRSKEFSSCFWLESTACFAWMMVKALSLSTTTSPWISPVDWATSSVQGQQRLTVEQSENNATQSNEPQKQHDQTEFRLQFWRDKSRILLAA